MNNERYNKLNVKLLQGSKRLILRTRNIHFQNLENKNKEKLLYWNSEQLNLLGIPH